MMYNKIVQVISGISGHDEEVSAEVKTFTIAKEVAANLSSDFANDQFAIEELLKNETFRDKLHSMGWRNIEEAKTIEEKLLFGKRLYINATNFGYNHLREIQLSDLKRHFGDLASKRAMLLQNVDMLTLKNIDPSLFVEYKKFEKVAQAQEKKKEAAQKKAAETKKQRRLEQAKKILKEAGL